ncbi:hypothetical protein RHCRD62_40606 [Rhodococcus sp. RD6.2]|nr:hypothetical protein RHCRD62_40606 [Rhodococcus sp. RD6.2]
MRPIPVPKFPGPDLISGDRP